MGTANLEHFPHHLYYSGNDRTMGQLLFFTISALRLTYYVNYTQNLFCAASQTSERDNNHQLVSHPAAGASQAMISVVIQHFIEYILLEDARVYLFLFVHFWTFWTLEK